MTGPGGNVLAIYTPPCIINGIPGGGDWGRTVKICTSVQVRNVPVYICCSWTPRSNKNSKWRWDQVLIVKFCVMLMNTWSMCIKMNILLMSVGLIVLSPLNTWCGSDVHFTLDMECDLQVVGSWATWGFFYTPWNTHRHLCQEPPKIIVSSHLGCLEVYLDV